ncbi:MAG: hypothetical protein FJ137_22815 [Deltaproteobacteria bacterium]|nr:hypothetical protein [Deltaproteobacteria bacterium]
MAGPRDRRAAASGWAPQRRGARQRRADRSRRSRGHPARAWGRRARRKRSACRAGRARCPGE